VKKGLSLYTGAGGLDLGLEQAGFSTVGCVEVDADCSETLKRNRPSWHLAEPGDIHAHTPEALLDALGIAEGELTICSGGAPCQPWSKASYWRNGGSRRLDDPRARTLHAFMDVVDVALPDVVLLENVRGLAYRGKDEGMRLIRGEFARINRRRGTDYRPQELPRIPGRVGQKLLHRLVAGRRLLQPKQRRLQALAAALLDQPAHVHKRVLALPPKRQPRRHPLNKAEQPVTNLDRRHLNCNRRLHQLLLER
jgi:hypothetical protein